jgi:tetratricopeptide (TPR) repeat protein
VLLDKAASHHIPLELRKYQNFRPYSEDGYLNLYRLLTNQPKFLKPILGKPLVLRMAKHDFRNLIWNVPPRNVFFTGRAKQLADIRKALEKGAGALSGLGGIGKTQIAIEYAYAYRGDYKVVLWSVADSRDALISGFAAFAKVLDLPEKDEKDLSVMATAVRGWLESNSGWLLILDNVDTIEDLLLVRQFAPVAAGGHVLITTRLQATGGIAELVELEEMTPEEGASFLLRRAKIDAKDATRKLARQISTEVDGLPLALDQAGAFIEETPSTLAEYLALYRAEGAALRARRGKLAPEHASVTITFSLAFAKLAEANPAAADVVRGCAFLAPDAVAEEIFTEAGSEWGEAIEKIASKPLAWVDAIGEAGRLALLRRDAESKTLHIHRLVQEVVKDEMNPETRKRWVEPAVGALSKIFPIPEFENWPQCERLLSHARTAAALLEEFGFASAAAARLLNRTGYYLDDRAQYAEAKPLYRRALTIREEVLGPEHADTATSLNNLALLYNHQGSYSEAEPLFQRALAIREKVLGLEHPYTATTLNNLALLYFNQGRYAEAEPLYKRAIAICEEAFGLDHTNTAYFLNNLASLYAEQGRYADAEQVYIRSLAIREKVLGPGDPHTATSLNNLAKLYQDQGRYAEAEPLFRRAINIFENALGPAHPNTIQAIRNYANLLRKLDRHAEADELEGRLS